MKAIFLILFLSTSSYSKDVVTISTGEWAPYTGKDLENDGICNAKVIEVLKKIGKEFEIKYYPWKRTYKVVQDGKVDGSTCWVSNEERKTQVLFSNPIASQVSKFVVLKKSEFNWEKMEDLDLL